MRSKSEAVATLRSLLHLLESIKRPGEWAALGTTRVAEFQHRANLSTTDLGRRPHDLRHTAASLWIAAGVGIKTVSTWLGHQTAKLTLDTYGHLLGAEAGQAALERVIRVVGHPVGTPPASAIRVL
jgi:integrase